MRPLALLPITLTLACGDVAPGTASSDAGRSVDAHDAQDAHADTASHDAKSADVAPPDAGTGCDSGVSSVACLAVAGPIYANGPITVDDTNVYWVEHGQVPAQDIIVKVPRAGGAVITLAHASAGALASDGTNLYFTVPSQGDGGSIMQVPVSGGEPTTLAAARYPNCLAIDDTSVYWTDPAGTGSVVKVAKTGGAPTVLVPANATVPDNMYGLALVVDATSVYWLDRSLFKVSKGGGDAVTLVAEAASGDVFFDYSCRSLVIAGNELVASLVTDSGGAIVGHPLTGGGTPITLVEGPVVALAASPTDAFWITVTGDVGSLDEIGLDGGSTRVLATPPTPAIVDLALAADGTLYWTTEFQVESLAP